MTAPQGLFDHIHHPQKRAFLLSYSECLNIKRSSAHVKVHRSLHHLWLKRDPIYAEAFAYARQLGVEALEEEAVRRARDGVERAVWYQGEEVGKEQVYSDVLLIFLLKGNMPEKYRERYEHMGKDGGALEVRVVYDEEPSDVGGA